MPSRLDHGSGAFAVLEGMKEEALKPNLFTFNRLRDSGQTEIEGGRQENFQRQTEIEGGRPR